MDDSQNQAISTQGEQQAVSSVSSVPQQSVQSSQQTGQETRSFAGQVHQQPQQPISGPNKEAAPIPQPVEQHIKPTEHKIELSDELKEAGVEHVESHERPELPPDVQQAGVTHAKETVELDQVRPPVIQLPPYKREEVLPHANNGPVTDAARWFYTFLLRQIDKVKMQNLTEENK